MSAGSVAWALADRFGAWPCRVRTGPACGLTVVAPLRRRRVLREGLYEPELSRRLAQLARPGAVAIDAGAHLGYHAAILARRVGPSGRVIAFEPSPRARRWLHRTVRANRFEEVEVVGQALGAGPGEALWRESRNDAMGRVQDGSVPQGGRRVSVTSLDRWASDSGCDRLDLLKIDVEGAEERVLAGARELLRRHRPAILCELHLGGGVDCDPERLWEGLRDLGYRCGPIGEPAAEEELSARLRKLEHGRPRKGVEGVAVLRFEARPVCE